MMWFLARKPRPILWKGLVAGAAGGMGATVAMTAFQSLWTYVDHRLRGSGSNGRESEDNATVKAAARLSEGFFGYELDGRETKLAGRAVHFGFGTAVGALHGTVAEYSPQIARGDGVPFGTGLMVVADEVAVPAMGWSRPPQETPIPVHLYALCSHVVYGFVLETLRRSVRRAI